MPTLSSLLVQHGVTSMRGVEEAISRQVLHGGDLATNVLALGAVHERQLTVLLGQSLGLEPAVGRLKPAAPEVLRTVPVELAVRYSVFPLDFRSTTGASVSGSSQPGDTLVIATAEPLTPAIAEDLGFALGVSLHQLAAPLVRIRQALADYYGAPLERRLLRLITQLDASPDSGPGETSPARDTAPPRPVTMPAPRSEAAVAAPTAQGAPSVEASTGDGGAGIEDDPTDEGPILLPDEASLATRAELGGPRPTLKPLPPNEIDDAATIESEAFPVEPPPSTSKRETTPQLEELTPRVDALASHLAQFLPQQDDARGGPNEPTPSSEPAASARSSAALRAGMREGSSPGTEDYVAEPTPRRENLSPTLTAAVSKGQPGGVAAEPSPASQPSPDAAQRQAPGSKALTGWLKRTVLAQRQHDTVPQMEIPAGALAAASTDGAADNAALPGPDPGARAAIRPVSALAAQRKPGPFTLAMAEQELASVDSSEGVLAVLFDFAQHHFQFTVLFTVHADRAGVRYAAGPGAERERVTKLVVSLEQPSALATARSRRAPVVAALQKDGVDAEVRRELGRDLPPNVDVALFPIVVRDRVVALVYGDDGAVSIELPNLGDLVALSGLAAAGLERLILRKKLSRAVLSHSNEAAGASNEASEGRDSVLPDSVRATSGPLSARTRAALLEMRVLRDEMPGGHVSAAGSNASRVTDASAASPEYAPGKEEANVGIDAVAKAFGLRGTGVEADPVEVDGDTAPAFESARPHHVGQFSSPAVVHVSPMPTRFPFDSTRDPASARAVFASAATAPMLQATNVLNEIPDLELPVMPAPPSAAELQLDDSSDAFAQRPSRPSWSSETLSGHGAEEQRDSWGPGSSRPQVRHRTSPVPDSGGSARAQAERRPGHSTAAGGDVRAEYVALVQHVFEGGQVGEKAFTELVRNGEAAISIIAARFPGPLRVDRQRFREQLSSPDASVGAGGAHDAGVTGRPIAAAIPPASQCGPILDLIVAIKRPALPFMTVRSSSPDPEVRFWATHVLGELTYPEAANALLPRLFDDSLAVRRIARRSAASLIAASSAGGPILQGLDHITRDREESPARRIVAIDTMGEIRSSFMVPALIFALADAHDSVVKAAARALVVIAREDFGHDVRKWNAWWVRNGERHRIEWVIDALTHERPALRRAASEELKGITKEYFGYYEDLPRQEREAAQARYRAWWVSEGRSRFRAAGH